MADESSASVIPLHQVQPPKRKKAEPSAPRMPVLEVELPGVMVSTLEPSELISEVT